MGQEAKASLAQFDVLGSEKVAFEFKAVCEKMGIKEAPIVTIPTINTLDCMGTSISVLEFCLKDFAKEKKFIRAFVDKTNKQVICEKGSRVTLKYECEKKDDKRCIDSEIACFDLKKTLAYNLPLFHHSIIPNKTNKVVSCIFDLEK